MKTFFIILSLVALGCNSNQQQKKSNEVENRNGKCSTYPALIDSLQVRDLYDSARWLIYTWHCEQSYLPKSDSSKSITFGELPLKFNNLNVRHDTLQLNFDFIDESEHYPILPSMMRKHKELVTGVGFDMKARNRIYMGSTSHFTIIEIGATTRYENPLQPEVITYIKNNWNKLDSCFKELAEQKGINEIK